MAYKQKNINETNMLCWSCKNAYGGCEWSKDFEPVAGWTAIPSDHKGYRSNIGDSRLQKTSYHIIACPKYEEDR